MIADGILLTQDAIEAVKTWRYKPMLLHGDPAKAVTTITVSFLLSQRTVEWIRDVLTFRGHQDADSPFLQIEGLSR
jgi:hypothetical protein